MPISYTIDLARRLVLTKAWGALTDQDLLNHKEALAHDPEFHAGLRQLSDMLEIERLEVTSQGVRAMVAHDDSHPELRDRHRVALVVPSDEVFGMARMYQAMSGPDKPVRVFRDMATAEAWLLE